MANAPSSGSVPVMGLNPFRPQSKTTLDIAMVAGALIVTLAVILWALFGG